MRKCLNCKEILTKRHRKKFCSNKCQSYLKYKNYIKDWKDKKVDGNRGVSVRSVSRYIKRYLYEKSNNKCQKCGWNKIHPTTGVIPLEIHHIDGNAENNKEENLELLCPNCHSLTPFFRNLNIGKGREWRKNKYIKNKT